MRGKKWLLTVVCALLLISSSFGISRTSAPPTQMLPLPTSKKRQMRLASVDLPPPDGPTSATVCPGRMSMETPRITSVLPS